MPYKTNDELPSPVKHVLCETHALDIYRKAFNAAWDEYKDPENRRSPKETREEVSHKVAWAAIKKQYTKDESSGCWRRKSQD